MGTNSMGSGVSCCLWGGGQCSQSCVDPSLVVCACVYRPWVSLPASLLSLWVSLSFCGFPVFSVHLSVWGLWLGQVNVCFPGQVCEGL